MKSYGVSAEFILPGRVGGAEFYVRNLIAGMAAAREDGEDLKVIASSEVIGASPPGVAILPPALGSGNRFLRELLSQAHHGASLDAILYPNYATPPWRRQCRIVTVIIDAQYHHMPENFPLKKRLWLRAAHGLTLRWAHQVVTCSEFVRRDLVAIHGSKWEGKIKVLPIPVSWERFDGAPAGGGGRAPEGRYVLTVAAQYPHKNLSTLIHAFRKVRETRPDVSLVLAGQLPSRLIGSNKAADLRGLIQRLGLEGAVRITGHVSDAELAGLYRGADLFVFPSLFEGFGIPPVEALGFGLPVLTTDRASLPEVTLGMARYLRDPLDPGEMSSTILEILADPARYRKRPEEIERIREHYSPRLIGRRYLDLMRG